VRVWGAAMVVYGAAMVVRVKAIVDCVVRGDTGGENDQGIE
jgi:hypothetical protein